MLEKAFALAVRAFLPVRRIERAAINASTPLAVDLFAALLIDEGCGVGERSAMGADGDRFMFLGHLGHALLEHDKGRYHTQNGEYLSEATTPNRKRRSQRFFRL